MPMESAEASLPLPFNPDHVEGLSEMLHDAYVQYCNEHPALSLEERIRVHAKLALQCRAQINWGLTRTSTVWAARLSDISLIMLSEWKLGQLEQYAEKSSEGLPWQLVRLLEIGVADYKTRGQFLYQRLLEGHTHAYHTEGGIAVAWGRTSGAAVSQLGAWMNGPGKHFLDKVGL